MKILEWLESDTAFMAFVLASVAGIIGFTALCISRVAVGL